MPPAYSPALDFAKPTGKKPAAVTSVPVQHRERRRIQAKVAARALSKPCSSSHHHLDGEMASSTRSPSAMINARG